eukprot:987787-Pelagomonas_calceolata.AAC.1
MGDVKSAVVDADVLPNTENIKQLLEDEAGGVIEAGDEGCCAPCIISYCNGWTLKSKIDFVFLQDGCGSAMPELVPLFDGVKGKSVAACKVILRAGRDWKGIDNTWDDFCSNYIQSLGVEKSKL